MMIQLSKAQRNIIQQQVANTIGYFVDKYQTDKAVFPLMANSFTIWRQLAYKHLQKIYLYQSKRQACDIQFHILSQRIYLNRWITAIKQQQQKKWSSLKLPKQKTNKTSQQMLVDYNRVLWKHTLYCQLFLDIVTYPYIDIYPSNKKFMLNAAIASINMQGQYNNQGDQIIQQMSEGIVKKGFSAVAEKVFTKTFILQASTLAVKLNPFAMIASFGFSELISYYRKEKKEEEANNIMQTMILKCKESAEQLQGKYEQCLALLVKLLQGDQKSRLQFVNLVQEVVEVDWLEVISYKDEQGYQVVILNGDRPNTENK